MCRSKVGYWQTETSSFYQFVSINTFNALTLRLMSRIERGKDSETFKLRQKHVALYLERRWSNC